MLAECAELRILLGTVYTCLSVSVSLQPIYLANYILLYTYYSIYANCKVLLNVFNTEIFFPNLGNIVSVSLIIDK